MSEKWFHWYCQQIDKQKRWRKFKDRYICPCCFMPTLSERGGYEICSICSWEDDGQDSDDAEQIRGGPNSDYSLSEARRNFEMYFTMYRPSAHLAYEEEQSEREKKKELYQAYTQAMSSNDENDWLLVLSIEKKYENSRE